MISVAEYIKIVLKKKNWTNRKLCQRLNQIEQKLGDRRTTPQNITNYLNGSNDIGVKWVVKVEKALELPKGILVSMVMPPITKEAKKELKELIEKVW